MSVIYSLPEDEIKNKSILTAQLPDAVEIEDENDKIEPLQPSKEVTLALANLSRLGCISLPTVWDGGEIFSVIYPAIMGRSLVEACTFDEKK